MMSSGIFMALLHNAALLLAMGLVGDLLAGGARAGFNLPRRIFAGLVLGLLAIALMQTSFVLMPGVVFDTRSVLLSVSGLFFGTVPTVIAMVLAALFRFCQGGVAAWAGIAVILAMGSIGILWRRKRSGKLENLGLAEFYLFGIFNHVVVLALMLLMPFETALKVLRHISWPIMLIYPVVTVVLALLLRDRLRFRVAAAERERLLQEAETAHAEMHAAVEELKKTEQSLAERVKELEWFNQAAVGRELRMIQLKEEVNGLCRELGREQRYRSAVRPDSIPEQNDSGGERI